MFWPLDSNPKRKGCKSYRADISAKGSEIVGDNMDYLINGGQLYFGTGESKKMCIRIRDDKIISIQPEITMRRDLEIIDASDYAVFPGLIYQSAFASYLRHNARYQKRILQLLNRGFTTFVDIIRWDQHKSLEHLIFETINLHSDSILDYTFCLSFPIQKLSSSVIRETSRLNIRQIILEVNSVEALINIDWEDIFSISRKYGIKLRICPYSSFVSKKISKKTVAEITNYWYYLNIKYGRVPLIVNSTLYSFDFNGTSPIYSETMLNEHALQPAKNAGIYPNKGSISVGSDADLIFVPIDHLNDQIPIIPHFLFLKGQFHRLPLHQYPITRGLQLNTMHANIFN